MFRIIFGSKDQQLDSSQQGAIKSNVLLIYNKDKMMGVAIRVRMFTYNKENMVKGNAIRRWFVSSCLLILYCQEVYVLGSLHLRRMIVGKS